MIYTEQLHEIEHKLNKLFHEFPFIFVLSICPYDSLISSICIVITNKSNGTLSREIFEINNDESNIDYVRNRIYYEIFENLIPNHIKYMLDNDI